MSTTPPATVTGAPRPALPYGLFSVLAPREGSADRWEGSVQFEGLGTPPTGDEGLIGPVGCDVTPGLPLDFKGHGTRGDADAFYVYQSEVCSPIGDGIEHSINVATARLALFEEMLVERVLWKQLPATLPRATATTASEVLDAVAKLEQAQADKLGSQGILHLSRKLAMLGLREKAFEVRNGRLTTLMGTPVVAGSGYGDSSDIVLSPQLFGYRSEVFTASNTASDLLNRQTNDLYGVAQRGWLIGFDPLPGDTSSDATGD